MKKKDAVVGAKVIACYDYNEGLVPYFYQEYDDNLLVGVITEVDDTETSVKVEWTDGDSEGDEEYAELSVLSLESERDSLDEKFNQVQDKMLKKMEQAAELVRQAGQLSKDNHGPALAELWEVTSPLISAMDENGWNSSSWGC